MNGLIIFLIILQFIATGVGAFFLAKQAKSMRIAITQAAAVGFILPFALYIIPYSQNPTIEGLKFFMEWLILSFVANMIAAIPVSIASRIFGGD